MACTLCDSGFEVDVGLRQSVNATTWPCQHDACLGCVQAWVKEELQWHVPSNRVRCMQPGCLETIPQKFVLELSPGTRPRPVAMDLKSQLQARLLGRLRVTLESSNNSCCVCQGRGILVANPECRHAACIDCWTKWAEKQLPHSQDVKTIGTRCIRPGCTSLTTPALLRHIAEESPLVLGFVENLESEVTRLKSTAGSLLQWGESPSEAGPVCSFCGQHNLALLESGSCQHAACELCWTRYMEKQLPQWRSQCTMKCLCLDPSCNQEVSLKLMNHLLTRSEEAKKYKRDMDNEVARLTRTAAEVLVSTPTAFGAGPVCTVCHEHKFALLSNPECHHAACESCWTSFIEKQMPWFRSQFLPHVYTRCLHPGCQQNMSLVIEAHVCTRSEAVNQFREEMSSEVKRLMHFSGQILDYGPTPLNAGPECPVCRERCLALISNPNCNHAACEDCWANWAVTYLPRCRTEKRACVRCIGPGCQELASAPLWSHACTRNRLVQDLEGQLAFRRRLQSNALYPAAVQVECPQSGCLGLGYHGFDTVMCFVCEHQWSPDDAGEPAPVDIDIELMKGEAIKKCPRCSEAIMKNGGCDHMTCRCGYEFWWSSLLPYRS